MSVQRVLARKPLQDLRSAERGKDLSDITEGLGTALEGGLLAAAVEGEAMPASVAKGHFAERQCLNCGTELVGQHCHNCGQRAHLHRTIGAFMHDLLHGALHLDGKTWRTLPMLVLRPGELTRRYINGERARFVSPMALFLFSIFLMFAVLQIAGISAPTDFESSSIDAEQIEQAGVTARQQTAEARTRLEAERQTLPEGASRAEEIETELDELDRIESVLQAGESFVLTESTDGTTRISGEMTGIALIDDGIRKWSDNPGLMIYKLQTNFYKFSWLLIPLSIPFVWLLFFWKRRFKAYDHAIFVTYSLSFVSLLTVLFVVLGLVLFNTGFVSLAAAIIIPIHIYKHLKHAYSLSRFGAAWRLVVLTIFIVTVLLLFLQLLILLGLMG